MVDIQSQTDTRQIPLEMVGIKNIALPFYISTKSNKKLQVIGKVDFLTDLDHQARGTHMSRFVEILYSHHKLILNRNTIKKIVTEAQKKLKTRDISLDVGFTFLSNKSSPVHKKEGYMDYECKFSGFLQEDKFRFVVSLKIPIMLLCPCSKAISKYNAHNQRSIVTLQLIANKDTSIEALIKIVEKESSCELFPLLKRIEEKYVTEKSYNNPKFVEDIVRDVVLQLKKNKNVNVLSVECESLESIHNHNAYAKYVNNSSINGVTDANS